MNRSAMAEPRQREKYEALIYVWHALAPVRTAVAHPCDETPLRGAVEAAEAEEHIDLYEHIDDPDYLAKEEETFESRYENPLGSAGTRWYLQVIKQLFMENRLAKGTFVGLGRRLNLKDITCPVYFACRRNGRHHHRERVFDGDKYLGTAKDKIEKKLVPSGHIGLFMGARNLKEVWPSIARWIPAH